MYTVYCILFHLVLVYCILYIVYCIPFLSVVYCILYIVYIFPVYIYVYILYKVPFERAKLLKTGVVWGDVSPSFREGMGGNHPSGEWEGMDFLSWPIPAGEGHSRREIFFNIVSSLLSILLRPVQLYLQIHTMVFLVKISTTNFCLTVDDSLGSTLGEELGRIYWWQITWHIATWGCTWFQTRNRTWNWASSNRRFSRLWTTSHACPSVGKIIHLDTKNKVLNL